jgi:hypothetical protein
MLLPIRAGVGLQSVATASSFPLEGQNAKGRRGDVEPSFASPLRFLRVLFGKRWPRAHLWGGAPAIGYGRQVEQGRRPSASATAREIDTVAFWTRLQPGRW